ncbi:hypothetical protein [Pleionea mediterranea]|uniref:Uncharacterized protein n=1 Tax=Pleionea mediterranea TaxID=523701 RepID=A0A316FXF1_9GAMM|nr:hypothetical protein [Pleionea mediterranea]PWK53012.1 hypothetical protein C8D97_104230 [Pleionea mediterranea]
MFLKLKKYLIGIILVQLTFSTFSAEEDGKCDFWPCPGGWDYVIEKSIGTPNEKYFIGEQPLLYELREYSEDTKLEVAFKKSYSYWNFVLMDTETSEDYTKFFEMFLPKVKKLMRTKKYDREVFIDPDLFTLIEKIMEKHLLETTEPAFRQYILNMKAYLYEVNGLTIGQVRHWLKGSY